MYETSTAYAIATEELLYRNGKFTTLGLKSSLVKYNSVLNMPACSISRYGSIYEADLSVFMLFVISFQWKRCVRYSHQTFDYLAKGHIAEQLNNQVFW